MKSHNLSKSSALIGQLGLAFLWLSVQPGGRRRPFKVLSEVSVLSIEPFIALDLLLVYCDWLKFKWNHATSLNPLLRLVNDRVSNLVGVGACAKCCQRFLGYKQSIIYKRLHQVRLYLARQLFLNTYFLYKLWLQISGMFLYLPTYFCTSPILQSLVI